MPQAKCSFGVYGKFTDRATLKKEEIVSKTARVSRKEGGIGVLWGEEKKL